MMVINNRFELAATVYLITDPEQRARIVTGIKVTCDGGMLYTLCQGINETLHYEAELSGERDAVMASSA